MRPEDKPRELEATGNHAVDIVKLLWPEFRETPQFSEEDKRGIDGYIGEETIQVKADRKIFKTGNLYRETRYLLDSGQDWRTSKSDAISYIFVTWNDQKGFAIKVEKKILEALEKDMIELPIRPTSFGFLIGIDELPKNSFQRIDFTLPS